jgi:hypothetical protein
MDFVLTSDLDWASEYCIQDFLSIAHRFTVRPTLFVTHESAAADAASRRGLAELEIHPNFLPDSDHGRDVSSVIDHILRIVPNAIAVRAHRYIDSPEIAAHLPKYGVKIDSNVCLHLVRGLSGRILANGLLRLPVFFEDDLHWSAGHEWNFEKHAKDFFAAGLKVLNFHPFFVALNIPDADFYRRHKRHIRTLTHDEAARLRYRGAGTRTFLLDAMETILARGHRFISLSELATQLGHETGVRGTPHRMRYTAHATG